MDFRPAMSFAVPFALLAAALACEARAEVKTTREAACRRAEAPPKLDGKLDDPCWKAAAPIEDFAASALGALSGVLAVAFLGRRRRVPLDH